MPLLPVPSLGSTNWFPWATSLQNEVAAHGAALSDKADAGHTHEGGGGGGGDAVGFIDGGKADSTFSDLIIDGGAA
jgi:hypothetical protein